MLIASAGSLGLPASRARPGTLDPRDVQQESSGTAEQTEGRAADFRPRPHQGSNHEDRRDQYWAQRHGSESNSGSDECPGPEPAATGKVGATRCSGTDHPKPLLKVSQ